MSDTLDMICILIFSAVVSAAVFASDSGLRETHQTPLQQKERHTDFVNEFNGYGVEERENAVKTADEEISKLNHTVARLEANIHDSNQAVDQERTLVRQKLLDQVHDKRQQLKIQIYNLQQGTESDWEELKAQTLIGYREFSRAVNKASQAFEQNS